MDRQAIIIGEGGHARVIHSIIESDYNTIGFATLTGGVEDYCEGKLLADSFDTSNVDVYLGIGDNASRKRVFLLLDKKGISMPAVVGSSAFVSPHAKLGKAAFVGEGAVIVANGELGSNSILNTNSSIDHDCKIGKHAQITVGVSIAGTCYIGELAFLGSGVTVIPNIEIGKRAQVCAHSLVANNVLDDCLVAGSPAKLVKVLKVEQS